MCMSFFFLQSDVDDDNRLVLRPNPNRPLPIDEDATSVTLVDSEGSVFIAEIIEMFDCYVHGGEPSYIWVELL